MQILTREHGRKLLQKVKPNKYRAKATEIDGIRFASKREAERWAQLCILQRTGIIAGLERQPRFPLVVAGIRVGTYVADFVHYAPSGGWPIVEDVKSEATKTALYRLKKKMVEAQYGIEICEI